MTDFEPLYNTSLTTGKTKVWTVRTEGDKVIVNHGFLNSKMVEHEEICTGKNIGKKNETTPEQQAVLVAKSSWDKKVKSGYNTNLEGSAEADSTTYFPMLANELTEKPIQYPCYTQPKLDGIRCLIYIRDGKIIYQSRNHSMFQQFPQLSFDISVIMSRNPGIDNLILDGELYNHDLTFQQITSIVRKKDHPDLGKIEYHLYDLYIPEKTYEERYQLIKHLTGYTNKRKRMVIPVETSTVKSRSEIETKHSEYVNDGYEGLMVRIPSGLYRQQSRSKDLLKYKHFKDDEFKVVGVHEGNGGIAVFECVTTHGRTFGVNMKCTKEEKQNYLTNFEKYRGKMLTVRYQEMTDDGVPRFPVGNEFRIDMN
jgi:ATP-dependent DNA ligase